MGKKKGNKAEENGEIGDVVEESAAPPASKETGKKTKKKKKDVDWEEEVARELDDMSVDETPEVSEPEPIPEKKEKRKEKKSKKDIDSEEEEEVIVKSKKGGGFAALMDEGDDDLSDDDMDEPVVKSKKGGGFAALMDEDDDDLGGDMDEPVVKSKKGGGFAALMDEGDDDLSDDNMDKPVVVVEKKDKKKNKKEDKPKSAVEEKNDKKKGKKGKKKKNEEDLDQILAELELEYKGEKPKEETVTTEEAPQPVEESGKKKKKKRKDVPVDDVPPVSNDVSTEKSDVPLEKSVVPLEKNDVPLEKNDVPLEKKDAPVEKNNAPLVKNDAPTEKNDASAEKNVAPVEKNDAIVEKKNDIVKKNDAPAKENDAPVEKIDTPAEIKEKDTSVEREDKNEASNEKEVDTQEDNTQEESSKAKTKKKKPKAQPEDSKDSKEGTPAPEEQGEENAEGEDGKKKKKKKKKDKDKEVETEDKTRKGKPSSKALAAMRDILAKQKEEEERLKKEEDERIKQEEERLRQAEEEKRIEQEKKDKKKQKEKERKERLKAEGKLLTPKQKADQRRAQEMLESLKAQGMVVPEAGERRPRPGTRIKPKKQVKEEKQEVVVQEEPAKVAEGEPMEVVTPVVEEVKEEVEEVKDAWDETSDEDEEEEEEDTSEATKTSQDSKKTSSDRKDDEDAIDDDDESEEEDESGSEESADEHMNEAEKRRQRAVARMIKRREENLKNIDVENLRAPVVCVLGHVDHGKTKILDKLRKTNVQEGEVGGITQQIGATNVPADAIRKQTHMIKDFDMSTLKFPGLLIIDTPGHESFRNLRSRGSSLCDIAILVVDVTQGLEPQTRESVNLLRKKGTPFIVALNKVDRVYEWNSHPSKDIREIINLQEEHSKNDFERRTAQVIQGLREEKLNSALFFENPNPKEYISLVPTSAISGDGMGNLIALICDLCQQRLKKNLVFTEELQCTVLEVKTIQGHGTTIDVILVNGRLREGDTILLAGTEGPIVTQIRSLLLPQPLKEIRVKGQYNEFKEISAAQGVKIAARDLEKAIAGLSLKVAYHEDEIDIIKEEVDKEFKAAMRSIKVTDRGVYVQASTLGALEALLEFFKTNKVPYSGIRVGPVVKRDVMKAAAMLEHDPMYAVILAFDVKVEKDAQELADKEGVKIFSEETIYHLGDRYVEYLKDYKKKKQDEFRSVAVFPSKLKIIPTAIFNKRDPIVLGVTVDAGILRTGTPLCVPSKEFVEIGIVTSMEFDHKNVDLAKKGVDVCIKIEPVPGHTPKLIGRHFEPEDILVSKISRESINACKDHFRDDLSKTDWKLMADLKKQFQIL